MYRNMELVQKLDIDEDLTEEQFMEVASIYIKQNLESC